MPTGFPDYQAFEVPVLVVSGGTGLTAVASNALLRGTGGSALAVIAAGSADQVLRVPGAGGAPAFGALDLSKAAAVTGVLPVASGGSGTATPSLAAGTGISIGGSWPNNTITNTSPASALGDPVAVAHGGWGSTDGSFTKDITLASKSVIFGATATKQISGGPEQLSCQYAFNAVKVWLAGFVTDDFNARLMLSDAGGPGIELGPGGTGAFSDQDTSFRRWNNGSVQLITDGEYNILPADPPVSGPRLSVSNKPYVDGILTSTTSQPADGTTVTVGSKTYRFKNVMAQAYDVQIGATVQATLTNLKLAIDANGTPGTNYYAGTLANPDAFVPSQYYGDNTAGVVNTNGTAVAWVSGPTFDNDLPGQKLSINGTAYTVSSVTDNRNLVLTGTAGVQNSVSYFRLYFHAYGKVRGADVATASTAASLSWDANPMTPLYCAASINKYADTGSGTFDVLALRSDKPTIRASQLTAAGAVLSGFVEGDAYVRYTITGDGTVQVGSGASSSNYYKIQPTGEIDWGPGDGSSPAIDLTLARVGAGQMSINLYGGVTPSGILAVGRAIPFAVVDALAPSGSVITIAFRALNQATGDTAFQSGIATDTTARFVMTPGGAMSWGPGGVAGTDLDALRSAAGTLHVVGAVGLGMKYSSGDTDPRILLDTNNNRIAFGPGNAPPDFFLARTSTGLDCSGTMTSAGIANYLGTYGRYLAFGSSFAAFVGSWPPASGYCFFQNAVLSATTAGNYALSQSYLGATYLNAASGQNVVFRINNATKMTLTATGLGIGVSAPNTKLAVSGLPTYANNAAAVTAGLAVGDFYRTGGDPDPVCVVH